MGRPWWYDSYWEKDKKTKQTRFRLPRRQALAWIALLVLSVILTVGSSGSRLTGIEWLLDFVYYLCRILTLSVFLRAIISWVAVSPYNLLVMLLNDITSPLLSPLRKVVPRLGVFDITPLVAIGLLYLIPFVLYRLLT